MDQPMNPFGFAARMGRGAESMLMMQRYELGDVIHLSGQKLADVISLAKPRMNRPSYLTRTFPSLRN
ncbi:hypothetical protein G5B38_18980 (plasmid) [Pseudohalocynthiibacter aestuariivivens]|nr:hypothetical protein [Pseudohalocynthiibacter aestuariivivens]QIE47723.1 hypothetical protein G5B38_18980 [Pseudohalocynthiibacter aestuariivivens]